MRKVIFIFILGFIGSLFRGLVLDINISPYVLVIGINAVASFMLATVISSESKWIVNLSERIKTGLMVGLIGGFSTFSMFIKSTVSVFNDYGYTIASTYLILSIIVSVLAGYFGSIAGKELK